MKRKKKIIRKSNKKCGLEKIILNFDKGLMTGTIYFEEFHRS